MAYVDKTSYRPTMTWDRDSECHPLSILQNGRRYAPHTITGKIYNACTHVRNGCDGTDGCEHTFSGASDTSKMSSLLGHLTAIVVISHKWYVPYGRWCSAMWPYSHVRYDFRFRLMIPMHVPRYSYANDVSLRILRLQLDNGMNICWLRVRALTNVHNEIGHVKDT